MALQDILSEDLRSESLEKIRAFVEKELLRRIELGRNDFTTGEVIFNIQHPSENQEKMDYVASLWSEILTDVAQDMEDNGFTIEFSVTTTRATITITWLPIQDGGGGEPPVVLPRFNSEVLFENKNQFSSLNFNNLSVVDAQLSISVVNRFSNYPGMSSWVPFTPYVITQDDVDLFTSEQYTPTRFWSFIADKMVSILNTPDILEEGYSFTVEAVSDGRGNLTGVTINSPGELQDYFYDPEVSSQDDEYSIAIRILAPNEGYEDNFQNGGVWIKLESTQVTV